MSKFWSSLAGLVLAVCFASPAAACSFWHAVTFADGSKGCISDFPLAQRTSPEISFPVGEAVPRPGVYVVAVPLSRERSCPAVVGMSVNWTSVAGQQMQLPFAPERAAVAKRRCESALRNAGEATGCVCEAVVVDGDSPLSKTDFAAASAGERVASLPKGALAVQAAPGCDMWGTVQFRDGAACIKDFPVAQARSPELSFNVADALPRPGVYVLAMPVGKDRSCPAVVGMSVNWTSVAGQQMQLPFLPERASVARHRCEAALRAAGGGASCSCEAVVLDADSPMTIAEFRALSQGQPIAGVSAPVTAPPSRVAQAAPIPAAPAAAVATAAATPSPAENVTRAAAPPELRSAAAAAPAAAAVDPTTARLEAELREMRERFARLERDRAEVARAPQSASREQPAVAKRTVRALVIGNSRYTGFSPLANPRNDAVAIAEKLRSFGIDVDLLIDANRDTMVKVLNDYATRAAGRDVNILFYAGHGLQVEGVNYLVPTDMRADSITPGYVKLAAISLNAVLDYLPARTRLVFLDACRDNPASRSLVATRSAGSVGLAPTEAATGTLIAYATKDGATAEDGAGGNSPYTSALLQHIDTPQDISLLLRQVRQTVMRATSNRQVPWEYGSLVGDQLVLPQMARP